MRGMCATVLLSREGGREGKHILYMYVCAKGPLFVCCLLTSSPYLGSGAAKDTASATSGWERRTASTC